MECDGLIRFSDDDVLTAPTSVLESLEPALTLPPPTAVGEGLPRPLVTRYVIELTNRCAQSPFGRRRRWQATALQRQEL